MHYNLNKKHEKQLLKTENQFLARHSYLITQIEVPNQYKAMLAYAQKRHLENKNLNRKSYDLF